MAIPCENRRHGIHQISNEIRLSITKIVWHTLECTTVCNAAEVIRLLN